MIYVALSLSGVYVRPDRMMMLNRMRNVKVFKLMYLI
jgi:hypothetical protein